MPRSSEYTYNLKTKIKNRIEANKWSRKLALCDQKRLDFAKLFADFALINFSKSIFLPLSITYPKISHLEFFFRKSLHSYLIYVSCNLGLFTHLFMHSLTHKLQFPYLFDTNFLPKIPIFAIFKSPMAFSPIFVRRMWKSPGTCT